MKAWINDTEIEFKQGETVLQAAKRVGIFIPTLCAYLPLDHTPGTCRVCLVEIESDRNGNDAKIVTACTTPLQDGMHIRTRTKKIREMQRMQVAWIFADHDQDCASCARHGDCELQDLALYVGLQHNGCHGRFIQKRPADWSANGLIRDVNKCIRCGRCIEVCRQVQGISALTMDDIGTSCGVGIAGAENWADSPNCVQCGQCSLVCPTGALGKKIRRIPRSTGLPIQRSKLLLLSLRPCASHWVKALTWTQATMSKGRSSPPQKVLGADYVLRH